MKNGRTIADTHGSTLERLMTDYGDSIVRICYLFLKDRQLAQDAAQETFIKAWNALHTLRSGDTEKAWLIIMIPDDNGEMSRLRTDASFGLVRNQTRLGYHLSCGPLAEIPEQILLVPTDHEDNPITDEAVTIPVIPSIFPF